MKLTFNSQEIEQALISYVSTQGINLSDKDVTVNMTAGRGPNGHTAELDITNKAMSKSSAPTPPPSEVIVNPPSTEEEPSPFLEDNLEPEDATPLKFGED